jgi:hypothetical protein
MDLISSATDGCCTGMVKHLTRVILYTTGMLNALLNGPNSVTQLEEFYSRVVWPASIG